MSEASFITELIANIGAVGVIFWLVYYVFKTLLPKRDADFTAALEKRDALFTAALDRVQDDNRRENDRIVSSLEGLDGSVGELAKQVEKQTRLLIAHDSSMRGEPVAGRSTEELALSAGVNPSEVEIAIRAAVRKARESNPDDTQEIVSRVLASLPGALGEDPLPG